MILPIVAYGDPVLKKVAEEIDADYPYLEDFIGDLFDTMYKASGVGLAAPQVGKSIRVFVVDASPFAEDEEELEGFKKVFINPIILEEEGKHWNFNEGCLSIPGIREDVSRQPKITIEYYNEKFELIEEQYDGLAARVIQHEYDHLEGVLFTDRISPLRRRLIKKKLTQITKGLVDVDYRMNFPLKSVK